MQKLTAAQMDEYVRNSYITVQTELPDEFHTDLLEKTHEVFEKEGNPGNNLLPRLPGIGKVLSDPVVSGALASVLGDDYFVEPHRHCHYRPPGGDDQTLHKDSFRRLRHRTRQVVAFYYPQDTTADMGPTSVVPGSHYYNSSTAALEESEEVLVTVKAGTMVIAHYDIWHRGTGNRSNKHRYMMKFLVARMSEPEALHSNGGGAVYGDGRGDTMLRRTFNWHSGAADVTGHGANGQSIDQLAETVASGSERDALDAAYRLADIGEHAVPALAELLGHESGLDHWELRRTNAHGEGLNSPAANAAYGLSAAGKSAVPALIERTRDPRWWVRTFAAETLGDIGPAASEAVPALVELASDEDATVRSEAINALGLAGQRGMDAVPALSSALSDDESLARNAASLSLARTGARAEAATPALIAALEDEDRYVRGNAVHALYRIDTPDSRDALLRHLMAARWCHSTTEDSLF